jgi:methionine-rich copper-binding protein CopC
MRRLLRALAALGVVALVSSPALAFAHALVLESRPAQGAQLTEAPREVYLRFNSKLEKRLSHVTIATDKGQPVALPIAVDGSERPDRLVLPLAHLGPGSYLVRYKVLAVDGHITEGILRFSVLEPK